MSGLDNMKSQILDEATHSAEAKIAEAKAKAEKMIAKAQAETTAQVEKISQKASENATNYMQRVESSNEMQRKQALLRAKQEVIAAVLDEAYNRIMKLDAKTYFVMIRKMLYDYILPEEGQIYFSAKDLKRMPEGFAEDIEKIAETKGGVLTVAKEAKEIEGGFVLVYGGIEENCTIKALFNAKREELSDTVHGLLF
jgi:V/A-type H+-transporting ATPase subunit E